MNPQLKAAVERAIANSPLATRMDAAESVFFTRQLEMIRASAFDVQYPELKARSLVPINNSVPTAAVKYTYRWFDRVGKAQVTADYDSGGPRVDVLGNEASQLIRGVIDAYGYSFQEARAAAMSGMPLPAKKAQTARDVIERGLDSILLEGDTTMGLTGLFNQAGTHTYTVPNGGGGTPQFDTKTPLEILTDLHGISNGLVENSKEIEVPDSLILPLTSYNYVNTTPMSVDTSDSILTTFLRQSPYISRVTSHHKLETAGGGATKRMVCYRNRADKLEGIISQEFEQFAPQAKGFELVTQCHARTGGVVLYFPKSVSYGDDI